MGSVLLRTVWSPSQGFGATFSLGRSVDAVLLNHLLSLLLHTDRNTSKFLVCLHA